MKTPYQTPHIIVVEIESEGIIANSPQYTTLNTTNSSGTDVSLEYKGIYNNGIGDGGFLNGK
ncbi:MAG: hypothetical protein K6E86_07560 [Bacteroidales bacterium]|nr:hypothetical protein [Bacteroidales bacterium]